MDHQQTDRFQFIGQDIPWLLRHWAEVQPEKPFLIWEPRDGAARTWTYGEFWQDVQRVAAGLSARGVGVGDKILLHSENSPEMVISWYACATVGAVAVTTNTRSVGAEIAFFVEKARCTGAITQPRFATLVAESAPQLRWVVVTADNSGEPATPEESDHGLDSFDTLLGAVEDAPRRSPDPMAPAGILFTSGTTSKPKAVVHTHANALWASRAGPINISLHPEDTYLVFLPFFHVNAQGWSVWSVLGVGATVVLQPKFSSSRFWEVVTCHQVTHISLLPFVFKAVAGQEIPESSLRVGVFGLVMPDLAAWLGIDIVPAWGMTETVTHAISTVAWRDTPAGSMGRPVAGYEAIVVDRESGELCTDGRPGELWVRGTRGIQLFLEYYDNPEAMAKSFTPEGWFKTGDVVRVDEHGSFIFCDRDSDMLKVGGENVSAHEVEDACRKVPGIAEVAVVGRSHPMLDEVPVAFVIRTPPTPGEDRPTDDALGAIIMELCAAHLADFKVPRAVHVVDELPRATLDKVAKNQLRELADRLAPEGA